jgi:hypothetical protein
LGHSLPSALGARRAARRPSFLPAAAPRNSPSTRPTHARVQVKSKQIHLGYFDNPQEAAAAYDFAAYILFEEFARLNVLGSECTSVSLPEGTLTKIVEAYLDEVATIQSDEAT